MSRTMPSGYDRASWTIPGIVAVVLVGGGALLLKAPTPSLPRSSVVTPTVQVERVTGANVGQSEETALRDLTPMFLPTARNASLVRTPRREPGKTFFDQETNRFAFDDAGWAFERKLPPVVTLNGKAMKEAAALDALVATPPGDSLAGFGRREPPVEPLPGRGAFLEVSAAGTGKRVLEGALPAGVMVQPERLWGPVEFLAAIDPAGLVASLTVTGRSGVDEVDAFWRRYLAQTFRIGERLPPGFYRIVVAP